MTETAPQQVQYRKAALDRVSSPDQIDRLVLIARPRDWSILATLAVLIVAALLWGILGSVATRVAGSGILINDGGQLFNAVASGDGTLVEMMVAPGDLVVKDQVVAQISQEPARHALDNAQAVLVERQRQNEALQAQVTAYRKARQEIMASRRQAVERQRRDTTARIGSLETRLAGEERLLEKGFTTQQKLYETRTELATAKQALSDVDVQIEQMGAAEVNARNLEERDLREFEGKVAEAERRRHDVMTELEQRRKVVSPTDGVVTEVKAAVGSRVTDGAPLVSVESGRQGLQLLLYVPPEYGKEIRPGMTVNIRLSTVKKEEFGTLLGRVTQVSEFPSTKLAMLATLQDDRLVQQFSSEGAPFALRIDLIADPANPSGYRWANGQGPAISLSSGTLADGEVVVRRQAPISLIIPLFSKTAGL